MLVCRSSFFLRLTFAYMQIKGTLIAIGGNEAKSLRHKPVHAQDTVHNFMTSGILYRIISEIKNPNAFIEVIYHGIEHSGGGGKAGISGRFGSWDFLMFGSCIQPPASMSTTPNVWRGLLRPARCCFRWRPV